VSTFGELFEQAEQEIRAHIESAAAEFTNYFVVQGAVLLASIGLWAQLCGKTDTDQRAMIEAPDKSSLEKVVQDLAEADDPEGVMASQLLTAVVNRPEFFVASMDSNSSRGTSRRYDTGHPGPSLRKRAGADRLTHTIDLCQCCGPVRIQTAHPPQSPR
jgi:hypothetical protein